jgi:rubredoxin
MLDDMVTSVSCCCGTVCSLDVGPSTGKREVDTALEVMGWRSINGKWVCPMCNRAGKCYVEYQKCIREVRKVGEMLKNRVYRKSKSRCPHCGIMSRMASHMIGEDDPNVFHRVCINCKHEWDTRENAGL